MGANWQNLSRELPLAWEIPRFKVSQDYARHARLIHVQLALSDVLIGVPFPGKSSDGQFCFALTDFLMRACRMSHASHCLLSRTLHGHCSTISKPMSQDLFPLLCLELWDKLWWYRPQIPGCLLRFMRCKSKSFYRTPAKATCPACKADRSAFHLHIRRTQASVQAGFVLLWRCLRNYLEFLEWSSWRHGCNRPSTPPPPPGRPWRCTLLRALFVDVVSRCHRYWSVFVASFLS